MLASCSESDSGGNCLAPKTLTAIVNPGNELRTLSYKEVYSDAHHKIYVSQYLTPNGDAIRDNFGFVLIKNDNTAYSNYPYEPSDHLEALSITADPAGFFSEGSITVSDNCNELLSSTDINRLFWWPHFQANTAEGTYKVNLKLKLEDNTAVDIHTTTEVLHSFYPAD